MKDYAHQNCASKLHFGCKDTLERPPSGIRRQNLHVIIRSASEPDGSSPILQQQDIDMHRCQRPKDCELHSTLQRRTHRFTSLPLLPPLCTYVPSNVEKSNKSLLFNHWDRLRTTKKLQTTNLHTN